MANSNYFENYSYFTVFFPMYGRQNSWCSANLMSVFISNYYSRCTGCDGIHFFHSSVYAAVFWVYDWNSVGSIPVFWLLQSSACRASRLSLFFPSPAPLPSQETQPGQLTPTTPRHTLCHLWHVQEYKLGERSRKGVMFVAVAFVFLSNPYTCWGPAFWEVAKHLPDGWLMGSSEWILPLLSLCPQLLLHLLNCVSIHECSPLLSVFSPLHGRGKWLGGSVGVKLLVRVNLPQQCVIEPGRKFRIWWFRILLRVLRAIVLGNRFVFTGMQYVWWLMKASVQRFVAFEFFMWN